jgi:hypothetical protein
METVKAVALFARDSANVIRIRAQATHFTANGPLVSRQIGHPEEDADADGVR